SAVQQLLPPNTALLEYFSGDSAVYVFILTGRALIFRQCPALSNLNLTVGDLRRALTDKNLRDLEDDFPLFSQSSRLLYDALLAPSLAALPSSIQHLMIVPDGLLHEVPFELLGKATESVNFKSFPYLLRRFTVGYASSASLLLKQSEAARQPEAPGLQSFIGFAPQYSDADTLGQLVSRTRAIELREGKYPDLPESRKEVREIAELLQGKAYLGAEASERQFKKHAAQGRILHLAMHTWLENRDPLFSKLFFTQNRQETEEDNDLNAVELYDLHLQARLVVLSACETGLGKIRQGEGVMSLARAFAYAGVPATLMSLWQVEDQATHALMVDFYRQLKTGLSKDQALQGAKLNYLGNCQPERASPYYWGGFVVSGSLNPLFRQ
ncbi:MAG: CHAT domain-containing protein, partial [Saprospiraceae bacterium]